jgi:hypothetical protein
MLQCMTTDDGRERAEDGTTQWHGESVIRLAAVRRVFLADGKICHADVGRLRSPDRAANATRTGADEGQETIVSDARLPLAQFGHLLLIGFK